MATDFCNFCSYNNLVTSNTVIGHKMAHEITYYSRDDKNGILIDSVILNR